jgi:hypothetical protein
MRAVLEPAQPRGRRPAEIDLAPGIEQLIQRQQFLLRGGSTGKETQENNGESTLAATQSHMASFHHKDTKNTNSTKSISLCSSCSLRLCGD